MVAMGLGRSTTISPAIITQSLPDHTTFTRQENGPASPFPNFAAFVSIAARINNLLNVPQDTSSGPSEELHTLQKRLMIWYQELPLELEWSPRK